MPPRLKLIYTKSCTINVLNITNNGSNKLRMLLKFHRHQKGFQSRSRPILGGIDCFTFNWSIKWFQCTQALQQSSQATSLLPAVSAGSANSNWHPFCADLCRLWSLGAGRSEGQLELNWEPNCNVKTPCMLSHDPSNDISPTKPGSNPGKQLRCCQQFNHSPF